MLQPASYGFGLMGTGIIAHFHAQAIQATPGAHLVAVYSPNRPEVEAVAARYAVTGYTDQAAFLRHPGLEVVNVCSPSGEHAANGLAAARAGKHLIVEKPLDVSLEAADRLIEACRSAGLKLAVISQRRFEPDVQRVRRAIEQGRFGRLLLGDATVKWYRSQEYYDSAEWRGTYRLDGGGALMNQGIHYVDLLQWMMGPVESVQALTRTADRNIEVEDIALALLTFRNGAVGLLEASTVVYPGLAERLEITGQNGTAALEAGRLKVWAFKDAADGPESEVVSGQSESGAADPTAISYAGHAAQIADMVAALREDREPAINGLDGRKPLEIILAVYRSAREGRPVRLPLNTE